MSFYTDPSGKNNRYDTTPNAYDSGRPRIFTQVTNAKSRSPQPPRTRKKWPPAPIVEDEKTSLSREHSPALGDGKEGEAKMKGPIDQMPILFEIGKEHDSEQDIPVDKKGKRESRRRSSSEDSFGPDPPTGSGASDSNVSNHDKSRRFRAKTVASSIKEAMDGKRRPEGTRRTESTRLPERAKATLNTPAHPTFQRSSSSKETYTPQDSQRLYPGTAEELKSQSNGNGYLGFAERHRTMSGSNNPTDQHRANVRHMSAMGYAGESQTPSFQRDHPMMYASPINSVPRNLPPDFRQPRDRDHDAIVSSSDSDASPDEMHRRRKGSRTASKSDNRPSATYNNPPRPPPKEPINQHSRQSSTERRVERNAWPPDTQRKRHQDPLSPTSKHSSHTSSPYPSPPATPNSGSRPASRDGPTKVIYPAITKTSSQPKRNSRPSSPVGGVSNPEPHTASCLRYSSRPNSPTLSASQGPAHHKEAPRPEVSGGRRDALRPEPEKVLETPPIQVPRSSRSPAPGLRINVQQSESIPPPKTWTNPNQDMRQRPFSNDSSGRVFTTSPIIPMSAPAWGASEPRPQAPPTKSSTTKQPKLSKRVGQLITCPRPGFTTKYDDWWTIPQIPDLDLCPDCKDSLRDNGFPGNFVRGQKRLPGTRTRCDMNVSWVRIACLLILSGRENLDVLEDLMAVMANEDPCPGIQGGIRKKWYRVYDDDADKNVSNFSVCPLCVRSIRVLFPNLKGTFNSYTSTSQQPKICDLTASVPRFARYVDLLDRISSEAKLYRDAPNTTNFIRMTRDFAGIRPCRRDDQFRGITWHYIPHLPDFTICGECFYEVVRPAQRAGSEIADHINKKPTMPPDANMKLSCQLYSPRMRAIFEECCRNQDIASLREHALARVTKERELQYHVDTVRNYPEELQGKEMQRLIEEWRRWE